MTEERVSGYALPAAALALVAGGLIAVRSKLRGLVSPAGSSPGSVTEGGLSERRRTVTLLLPNYVPSKYPDEKFKKLAPGYESKEVDGEIVQTSGGEVLPKSFTTCGYLPCRIGYDLKLDLGITQCGLEQLRTNARKWNAWIEPGDGRMPRPGDVFGIDKIDAAGNRLIVHVGIFIGVNPDGSWHTADAGQGTKKNQEAKFLDRAYDPKALTLSGPDKKGALRPIAGWCTLDLVPLDTKAAKPGKTERKPNV